jgi:hypothetical protein
MAERAEAGQPHGRIAYGWRREQVYDDQGRRIGSTETLHPEQAEIVRTAANAVLAGESLRGLVADLNARAVPTLTGTRWSTTALRGVLLRERNAGLRVHQGQVIGKGDWEPLHDEDTHRRLVAVLTDPARRVTPASSAVKYMLSGIGRCGVCAGPLRVIAAGHGGRKSDSYTCTQGFHVRRSRSALDDLVTRLVIGRLSQPDAAGALARADDGTSQEAADKAAAIRVRLDGAADAYAEGTIDGVQLARITGKLRPELEQWTQVARSASTAPDLLDLARPDIADRWEGLPLARKRAVIDLLLHIEVLPATKHGGAFDPESVRITWKTS